MRASSVLVVLVIFAAACSRAPRASQGQSGRLEFVDVAREAGIRLVNRSGDARQIGKITASTLFISNLFANLDGFT